MASKSKEIVTSVPTVATTLPPTIESSKGAQVSLGPNNCQPNDVLNSPEIFGICYNPDPPPNTAQIGGIRPLTAGEVKNGIPPYPAARGAAFCDSSELSLYLGYFPEGRFYNVYTESMGSDLMSQVDDYNVRMGPDLMSQVDDYITKAGTYLRKNCPK